MPLFRNKKPKSFVQHALTSCRRLRPEVKWEHNGPEDQITGDGITINLSNLRLIWDAKDAREQAVWLEGHLSEVLYRVSGVQVGPPPDADLRAMIRPRVIIESSRLEALVDGRALIDAPSHRDITDDLVGVLGVDSPTSITLVSASSIGEWDTTFDDLWAKGIVSVGLLPQEQGWASKNSVFVSGECDDYTNSRLVNHAHLEQLGINGPTVVFLPHRNSLIVAPLLDDTAIASACSVALQEVNAPSPICTKPFVYDEGRFEPLIVGPEHPAYAGVSLLRLIDDDANYKQVAPTLAKLLGSDVTIGGFYVDSERLLSSTNWGPSPALLPRTDEVVFLDNETAPTQGMKAAWSDVEHAFGSQLERTDHYPTRYSVNGLPEVEAIKMIAQPLESLPPFE